MVEVINHRSGALLPGSFKLLFSYAFQILVIQLSIVQSFTLCTIKRVPSVREGKHSCCGLILPSMRMGVDHVKAVGENSW